MQIIPVILCGGSGTRLWPLSRGLYPKQFMDLGHGRTLFKDTLQRIFGLVFNDDVLVVCNEEHLLYVENSLHEGGVKATIILEPVARNTAPAIALAAHAVLAARAAAAEALSDPEQHTLNTDRLSDSEPLLLIMPSDHAIGDAEAFRKTIQAAEPLAAEGAIVTFGVEPTSPETGYGYISAAESVEHGGYRVDAFIEKPPLEKAEAMLAEGGYYWNSGLFFVKPSVYLQELEYFSPDLAATVSTAWHKRHTECYPSHKHHGNMCIMPDTESFCALSGLSIDYAVMEHTSKAVVCPLATTWNDLGSWESFYQLAAKDSAHNVRIGDVLVQNSQNCYLHSTDRLLAALDLEDLAIIETQDAVLVAKRDALQKVKVLVEQLALQKRPETHTHLTVYRPWGHYETLSVGARFQVNRITVNPGKQLSMQMHYHRTEHWVVVSGTAEIIKDGVVAVLTENQSTYIPPNTVHRLKNPGRIPLIIIETQSGAYLGEDDIVRFDEQI